MRPDKLRRQILANRALRRTHYLFRRREIVWTGIPGTEGRIIQTGPVRKYTITAPNGPLFEYEWPSLKETR